jgi:hypothetical protein
MMKLPFAHKNPLAIRQLMLQQYGVNSPIRSICDSFSRRERTPYRPIRKLHFNCIMPRQMRKILMTILSLLMLSVPAKANLKQFMLIREEAVSGDAKAQNKLGVYYQLGLSVEQSDTEAVKWFHMAAEQGEGEAQFNLGESYEYGRGVPVDKREALSWYRRSCDNGCRCGCRSYRKLNRELEKQNLRLE